jgi:hypothetical protein
MGFGVGYLLAGSSSRIFMHVSLRNHTPDDLFSTEHYILYFIVRSLKHINQ